MKLNITVEIDWIEEDGSIDETIQEEIIAGVHRKISQQCLNKVEKKSQEAINASLEVASKKIEEKAVSFVDDWLNNEVEITDRYGDIKDKGNLRDIIKRSFNDILNKKVDSNGNFTKGGYGSKGTLVEYLSGKMIEKTVSEHMNGYQLQLDKKIKEEIDKGIKNNVSDMFAKMVVGAAKQQFKDQQAITQENK